MAEKFYTILTNTGKAKIANAQVLGTTVNITEIAVGDGNGAYYEPTADQTALINEVWRGSINSIDTDDDNPNWIVVVGVIPTTVGGFTVREVGIFDDEGDLIAVGKYPETYKPVAEEGSAKDLYIKMILEVSNASAVTLKIDQAVVLATKEDINDLAGTGRTTETVKGNADALAAHLADNNINSNVHGLGHIPTFKEENGEVYIKSPAMLYFYVDENGNVFFRPDGTGNAFATIGEEINVWKVG